MLSSTQNKGNTKGDRTQEKQNEMQNVREYSDTFPI